MRSSGPIRRPLAGSVTADTKLSTPRCTPTSQSAAAASEAGRCAATTAAPCRVTARMGSRLPHDLAGVEQVERVQRLLHGALHRLHAGVELGAHAGALEQADAVLAGDRPAPGDGG